jgi:hypothetical protein
MIALIFLALNLLAAFFKSKSRLGAENAALRQQLILLQRKVRGRVQFENGDRLFFVQLYRWFPSVRQAMLIIRPETLVRWHRAGFRGYWRRKSRSPGGRPPISKELRALIRQMSLENPLWGAPRIHGELLKLGFAVSQPSASTWPGRVVRLVRVGVLLSAITGLRLQRWICSLCPPSDLTCSMPLSLSGWLGESLYGSMSRHTRRRNGLRSRLPKHSPGTRHHAT